MSFENYNTCTLHTCTSQMMYPSNAWLYSCYRWAQSEQLARWMAREEMSFGASLELNQLQSRSGSSAVCPNGEKHLFPLQLLAWIREPLEPERYWISAGTHKLLIESPLPTAGSAGCGVNSQHREMRQSKTYMRDDLLNHGWLLCNGD